MTGALIFKIIVVMLLLAVLVSLASGAVVKPLSLSYLAGQEEPKAEALGGPGP